MHRTRERKTAAEEIGKLALKIVNETQRLRWYSNLPCAAQLAVIFRWLAGLRPGENLRRTRLRRPLTTDHLVKINLDIYVVSGQSFISPLKDSPSGWITPTVSCGGEPAICFHPGAHPPSTGIIPVWCAARVWQIAFSSWRHWWDGQGSGKYLFECLFPGKQYPNSDFCSLQSSLTERTHKVYPVWLTIFPEASVLC